MYEVSVRTYFGACRFQAQDSACVCTKSLFADFRGETTCARYLYSLVIELESHLLHLYHHNYVSNCRVDARSNQPQPSPHPPAPCWWPGRRRRRGCALEAITVGRVIISSCYIMIAKYLTMKIEVKKLRNVIQAFPVLLTFHFKASKKCPTLLLSNQPTYHTFFDLSTWTGWDDFSISFVWITFSFNTSSDFSSLFSDLSAFSTSLALSLISIFMLSSTALIMLNVSLSTFDLLIQLICSPLYKLCELTSFPWPFSLGAIHK